MRNLVIEYSIVYGISGVVGDPVQNRVVRALRKEKENS